MKTLKTPAERILHHNYSVERQLNEIEVKLAEINNLAFPSEASKALREDLHSDKAAFTRRHYHLQKIITLANLDRQELDVVRYRCRDGLSRNEISAQMHACLRSIDGMWKNARNKLERAMDAPAVREMANDILQELCRDTESE